jgi:hypothetical protein
MRVGKSPRHQGIRQDVTWREGRTCEDPRSDQKVPPPKHAQQRRCGKYPALGSVDRVVKLSNGEYEVHNIGVNWPHHVFVNQNFKVVGAD